MLGKSFSPLFVSVYSTVGGTVANTCLVRIPFSSMFFNSFTNMRVLIPSMLRSNSLNRMVPFDSI